MLDDSDVVVYVILLFLTSISHPASRVVVQVSTDVNIEGDCKSVCLPKLKQNVRLMSVQLKFFSSGTFAALYTTSLAV